MIRTTALVLAGLVLSAGLASACPYANKTVSVQTPITTAEAPISAPTTVQR